MGLKGIIQPNHVPLNKFELFIVGIPPITFVTISGISEELQIVDLPDRTKASGGQTNPVSFTGEVPIHHTIQQIALEFWWNEAQDPVTLTYKKIGTLILKTLNNTVSRTFTLPGLFISQRNLPDLDLNNEGEMTNVTFQFEADDMFPV